MSHLLRAQENFDTEKASFLSVLELVERGHLELAAGRSARPVLDTAESLASSLDLGPASELGDAMNRLRRAQAAYDSGQRAQLYRGECIVDLPEGLRRWLAETGALDASTGRERGER